MIIIKQNGRSNIYLQSSEIEDILDNDINISDITEISIYAENPNTVRDFPFPDSSYKIKINHCFLTELPENIPHSTEKLDISYNNFRHIDLTYFENIKKLKIKNNKLISIRLPPNLIELYINNNNLANINNIPDTVLFIDACNNLLINPIEDINDRCEVVSQNNLYSNRNFTMEYQVDIPFIPPLPPLNLNNNLSSIPPNNFFIDIPLSDLNQNNQDPLEDFLDRNNILTNSQDTYQPLLDMNGNPNTSFFSEEDMQNLITLTFEPFPNEVEPELEDTDFLDDECVHNNYQEKIKKINELVENKDIIVPDNFICPISKSIFYNPVILCDGHTYEKMHILEWLKYNNKSPMTNKVLNNKNTSPNILIRGMVREWINEIEKKYDIKCKQNKENNHIDKLDKKIKND
jgi:hypothetical protein